MVSVNNNRDDFQDFADKPSSESSVAAPGNFTRMFFGSGAPSGNNQAEVNDSQIPAEARVTLPENESRHDPLALSQQPAAPFASDTQAEKPEPGLFTKMFKADSLGISSPGFSAAPPLNSEPDLTSQPAPQSWPYQSETDRGNFSDVFRNPFPNDPARAPIPAIAHPPAQSTSSEQPAGFTAMFSTAAPGPGLSGTDTFSLTNPAFNPQPQDNDTLTAAPHPLQMVSPSQGTSQATKLFSLGNAAPESLPFQGGPSDYTRIVSGSTLRSSQENPDGSAMPAPNLSSSNSPQNAPIAFPQPPSWPVGSVAAAPALAPVAIPQMPYMPSPAPPSIATPGAWSMPSPPVQAPVLMPPAPPQAAPEPPRPPSPPWVTYLPLIIFFNFLFFLIVVLVLFFAFKK